MQSDTKETKKNVKYIKYTSLVVLFIALALLLTGFYLYYFYPEVIPGMASRKQLTDDEVNVLIFGFDDLGSIDKGKADADLLVLSRFVISEDRLELVNILPGKKISLSGDFNEEDLKAVIGEIEAAADIKVDYYFSISYNGFNHLVNNLGGIMVNMEERLRVPELGLYLKSGENILNGKEALNYSRWYDYRKDETDRTERQQQVMNAIIEKAFKDKTILDLPQLFKTMVDTFKMVETNIPFSLITDFVNILKDRPDLNLKYDVITISSPENNINREGQNSLEQDKEEL